MATPDYELRERIERVRSVESDHTDLLTLAVPPERPLGEVREEIEEDHAEAEYLDADHATQGDRDALDSVRHTLLDYESVPENGLVVYAGDVDGETVSYVFDDLPHPVTEWTYEFDNEFDADPLRGATEAETVDGLVVVERGGAVLGRLRGDDLTVEETLDSQVMGKTKAGGQSAQRFERERERQKHEFFEEVAEEAERAFLGENEVDRVLVGGSEVTADEFLEEEYLDHRLRDKVAGGAFSVEYASEQGLRQLVDRAEQELLDPDQRATRDTLEAFFERVKEGDGEAVYGREATEEALDYGAVDTLIVAETQDVEAITQLEEETDEEGGDAVVVSTDFEDGRRFDEAFGGVGALLRFPIE
ncbi:peptide chain release factor 1 [Halostella sp. JP-L12]|uniref:peptide chain release factor aRF-1 n=1 Tax=Halostella TaxID=1843185 RepID=UPI000EF7BFF5|nr:MULTISPECIES: peptide chain release factor aRF-1 [Halostella]NHN49938.1 peptide chain release factor 1 [Halostella sp. JP-L12]